MKSKIWIVSVFLTMGLATAFAQSGPFVKSKIHYNYYSGIKYKYILSVDLNRGLRYDGLCTIYDRKDTSVVGLMHYKEGLLMDSLIIDAPELKLTAFFVSPSNDANTFIDIEELGEHGVPHGEFVQEKFYNGERVSYEKYTYSYGKLDGACEEFNAQNEYNQYRRRQKNVLVSYTMKNDRLQGYYLMKRPDGDTVQYGLYENGKKEGCWIQVREHDSQRTYTCYQEGQNNGINIAWNKNGQLVLEEQYVNGKLNGRQRSWFSNGVLETETYYKMGLIQGVSKRWSNTGVLMYAAQYDSLGERNGLTEAYYSNGKKDYVQHYAHGKLEGYSEYWNEKGILTERNHCHLGAYEGKYETFYDSGRPKKLAYYTNDKLNGTVKEWNDIGELTLYKIYKNGEVVKTIMEEPEPDMWDGPVGNMVGEGPGGPGNYYVPKFYTNYVNIRYDNSLRCVSRTSEALADTLNIWYQSLSKKQKKKFSGVQQIEISFRVDQNSVLLNDVKGIDEKMNREIFQYLITRRVKGCYSSYPYTIKAIIPFEPPLE